MKRKLSQAEIKIYAVLPEYPTKFTAHEIAEKVYNSNKYSDSEGRCYNMATRTVVRILKRMPCIVCFIENGRNTYRFFNMDFERRLESGELITS